MATNDRIISIAEKIVREGRVARQFDNRSELSEQHENYLVDRIRVLTKRVRELETELMKYKGELN